MQETPGPKHRNGNWHKKVVIAQNIVLRLFLCSASSAAFSGLMLVRRKRSFFMSGLHHRVKAAKQTAVRAIVNDFREGESWLLVGNVVLL